MMLANYVFVRDFGFVRQRGLLFARITSQPLVLPAIGCLAGYQRAQRVNVTLKECLWTCGVVSQPQTTSDLWKKQSALKCSRVVLATRVKTGRQVLPAGASAPTTRLL